MVIPLKWPRRRRAATAPHEWAVDDKERCNGRPLHAQPSLGWRLLLTGAAIAQERYFK
jgi:hypothetical protein